MPNARFYLMRAPASVHNDQVRRKSSFLSFHFLDPFVPIAVIIITSITESDHGPLQKCMCCWDQTHLKQEAWIGRPSILPVI